MNDMILKSMFGDHADDLTECFETLRKHNMIINLNKCTFGIASGKFLGYLVIISAWGIQKNLEKIQVIIDMEP